MKPSLAHSSVDPRQDNVMTRQSASRWHLCRVSGDVMELQRLFCLQVAPQAVLTDDEQEHRMKLEYDAYLEEESVFLRDLGLLKDELPPASEQVAVA